MDDKTDGSQSKVMCWGCGVKGHQKWSAYCPAKDKECLDCKREGHFKAQCKVKKNGKNSEVMEPEEAAKEDEVVRSLGLLSPEVDSGSFFSCEPWMQVGPLQHSSWDLVKGSWSIQNGNVCRLGSSAPAQCHHIWVKSKQKWVTSRMKPHHKRRVRAAVSKSDYKLLGLPAPEAHCSKELEALVDTGAMMVVMGLKELGQLGVCRDELLPTVVIIQVANGSFGNFL